MKEALCYIVLSFAIVLGLLFGIDREITRRDYLARTEMTEEITGCIFDTNCRHYNKLLKHTDYNKED
jgi:uncharacterized membrane protein YhiD involved in acid resistance